MRFFFSTLILLCLSANMLPAQNGPIRKLYRKYKHEENATAFSLPRLLLHAGLGIANGILDEETRKAGGDNALSLAWNIKKVRVLTIENNNPVPDAELERTCKALRRKGHEDLLFIRNKKGARISIMIRDKKQKLRSIFILVSEANSFTLIHLKARIRKKDLWNVIETLLKHEGKEDVLL